MTALANGQPHLHALVSAGVLDRQGELNSLALPPAGVAEELFRRRVVRMLVRRGRLEEAAAAGLLSWPHSGFSVHHAIRAWSRETRRASSSCAATWCIYRSRWRLRYDGIRASYRGRRVHPVSGAQSLTVDPLEMRARLCQHIPPPGLHLTRLYGAYANRTRGAWARRGIGAGERRGLDEPDIPSPSQRARRREWARLIAKVFEVDPLRCACGTMMRVVGFIFDNAVIRKILKHQPEARAHAPPGGKAVLSGGGATATSRTFRPAPDLRRHARPAACAVEDRGVLAIEIVVRGNPEQWPRRAPSASPRRTAWSGNRASG